MTPQIPKHNEVKPKVRQVYKFEPEEEEIKKKTDAPIAPPPPMFAYKPQEGPAKKGPSRPQYASLM